MTSDELLKEIKMLYATLEGLEKKVDLSKEFGPPSSGKTIIIASTKGNVAIDGHDETKIGLNVYRRKRLSSSATA